MTWREDLRTVRIAGAKRVGASFRGVPFFVDTAERAGGRRVVVHEFPFRDDPFLEDLGRKARRFRVEGYVIGDDYLVQRDALLAALEDTSEPGELVHPYYGIKRAICESVSVREASRDGGMAMFALEFCEAPTQAPTPTQASDPAGRVAISAAAAVTATKAELVQKYDVAGLPAFAIASAETALTSASAALGATLAPVATTTQELATLTGQIALMTSQASSLVRAPADLFDAFQGAISGLIDTAAAAPGAMVDALTDAYSFDLGAITNGTTTTRQRELANQLALTGALRRAMAIEAARLAPLAPYVSIEDAAAARDSIAAQLEEQAGLSGDTAYPALVTLRSDVLRAVPGGDAFASIVAIARNVPIPSLLLAYQLYGDVDQEPDLIARNRIAHPGFVAGSLQVLSSDA